MKTGAVVETTELDSRSGYQFQDGWQAADTAAAGRNIALL
jgi:hypothetical protein